ncbi:hypothetical protein F5B20DRAFT_582541 [Whalleya microplaca]|nr:hypothetical protein F5B20DRAFT_582541 [Whalleya microplaca]
MDPIMDQTADPSEQEKRAENTPAPSCKPQDSQDPSSNASRAWRYVQQPVAASTFIELELIILTFCIGIQDAISFPDFHCFASNQTGNTVFLMLAIILPELNGEMFFTANIGAALGFFLVGNWVTGQIGHIVGPRRRCWLIVCNCIQTCLVFAAGAIQYRHGTAIQDTGAVLVVSLLAFASGSQVVAPRTFALTEITTAMATAAWVDLMIDPKLFKLDNKARTRRVLFLFTLVMGSLAGAGIYKTAGSAVAIFVSAGGKLLVTGMFFFNGTEKERRTDGENAC